jgi:hypothetical protein
MPTLIVKVTKKKSNQGKIFGRELYVALVDAASLGVLGVNPGAAQNFFRAVLQALVQLPAGALVDPLGARPADELVNFEQ